jgi:hypothetical protein
MVALMASMRTDEDVALMEAMRTDEDVALMARISR